MTEGAKLVTDDPGSLDREVPYEPLDTNRPVALVGVSHEHLENQENGESKSEKNEEGKKTA